MRTALTTLHKLIEVRSVENKLGLLPLCRCSPGRPTKQRGNRRVGLNPRIAHSAPFQDKTHLLPQQKSVPKRKRKERDKRSQDRQNEQPSNKPSRTIQKALGRDFAFQLPMTNRWNPQLLECISDYSLHASHCWWRMSTISNLFFSWCICSSIVPPLDRKQCKHQKRQKDYEW